MEDKRKLFDDVADYLIQNNYGFVVDQVRNELATGVLIKEKIPTLTEVESENGSLLESVEFKKTGSAEFVKRQDYSDVDALVLLLQAARRAILDGAAMVAEIKSTLRDFNIVALNFESEYDLDNRSEVIMDRAPEANAARNKARDFNDLIEKARVS